MNWVDIVVVLCVALALLAVIFYKLYPLLFKKKKVSRKAKELVKDYNKAKKKEGKYEWVLTLVMFFEFLDVSRFFLSMNSLF